MEEDQSRDSEDDKDDEMPVWWEVKVKVLVLVSFIVKFMLEHFSVAGET